MPLAPGHESSRPCIGAPNSIASIIPLLRFEMVTGCRAPRFARSEETANLKALDCARRSYKPRQLHGSGRPPALGGDHRRGLLEAAIITHERHEGARLVQAIHADD